MTATTSRTFLIGDVRGYTRFTQLRGDAAAAHLARTFAALAADAVAARGGAVIEVRGDEVLAVLDRPAQAVRAALELQAVCAEVAAADEELPLHVGIGIDAGEAVPVGDGFRGVALNRAARLCSQAAGGEVLVTREVAAALAGEDDLTTALRGAVDLKGFDEAVELHVAREAGWVPAGRMAPALQREADGAGGDPLAGREVELSWLRGTWRQARRGRGRLVFVDGPAGIGKTRLASELLDLAAGDATAIVVGAGGTAAADALTALRRAGAADAPTVVVLDDLDATAAAVAGPLEALIDEIARRPVLAIGLLREADGPLAAVVAAADRRGDGRRTLRPLDREAVHALVARYAGAAVDEAPVERILRASGGVPARVHDLAGEWARAEAARRLEAAAQYLGGLRDRRADDLAFADNVIALGLGRLYGADARVAIEPGGCPYKGLAAFGAGDAALFVGRERLVGELAARTVEAGVLGVVGTSGSGKSSAVAAGLLPSLRAGLLPGSERWRQATMRPGEHPVAELAAQPRGADGDERLVLVVDQFEEVFTLCDDAAERAAFLESLAERGRHPSREVVVLVLRADFYGACAEHAELAGMLAANHVLLGPMNRDELRRAIELPARRAGLRVDAALADALAAEAGEAPGVLPLLSTALVELWQARRDDRLRLEDHERTGGIHGAVARLAESTFAQFDKAHQAAARGIFLRLVASGEAEGVTRRRVPTADFDVDRDPIAREVLDRLVADRLLTRGEDDVEVAHEALLREWPRLQGWLAEDRQGREVRRHLGQAARHWRDAGRDDAELYRGARLSAVLDWAAGRRGELNDLEREFLDAGRRAMERDADRQRRANRRLRGALAGAVALLLIALVAGGVALIQRSHARHAATVALADSLGSQGIIEGRFDRAMLLAREAVRLDDSERTRGDLLSTLNRSPQLLGTIAASPNRLLSARLSPDGRTLALVDNQTNATFVDPRTGRRLAPPLHGFIDADVSYSPDGRSIVASRFDQAFHATGVDLLDARTHRVTRHLAVAPQVARANGLSGPLARFSPDGHTLVVAFDAYDPAPGLVERWDLRSGRSLGVTTVPGMLDIGFLPGGRRFVAVGHRTLLLDTRDPRVVRSYAHFVAGPSAVSPDGRLVAGGGLDGTIHFLDLRSGRVTKGDGAHTGQVDSVAFTPDGRTLVSGGDDAKVLVWDVPSRSVRETLSGHTARIPGLAITGDGRTLYSASLDGAVFAWDLTGRRGFGTTFQASNGNSTPEVGPNANVALSPDGRLLATGQADGRVAVWDLRTVRRRALFQAIGGQIGSVAFGPGGRTLAVAGLAGPGGLDGPGQLRVFALAPAPHLLRELHGLYSYVFATATADGRRLVASGLLKGQDYQRAGELESYDLATGRRLAGPLRTPGIAGYPTISADGRTVTAAIIGGKVVIAGLADLRVRHALPPVRSGTLFQGALSPDGRHVATVGADGHLVLRDARSGRLLADARGAEGPMLSVSYAPDGRTLLTSGVNSGVRLWDAATLRELGSPLPAKDGLWLYATLSRDGRQAAMVDEQGHATVWPVTQGAWERRACAVAGRSFTGAEWHEFVTGRPYERGCISH